MARYIDADALLSEIPNDLPYKGSVKRVLMQFPTADVVPESELESVRELLGELQTELEEAKSEVAREVISEFKALVTSRMLWLGIYPAALNRTLEYVEKKLTEKYTEGA